MIAGILQRICHCYLFCASAGGAEVTSQVKSGKPGNPNIKIHARPAQWDEFQGFCMNRMKLSSLECFESLRSCTINAAYRRAVFMRNHSSILED